MAGGLTVRAAHRGDAAAICAVFNEGIADRQATFETNAQDVESVRAWFDHGLPFLVAVDDGGDVVGWAHVRRYSERPFYRGVGEHRVYVARASRGRGAGRLLLEALAAESERQGFYKLTSRVFTTNAASLAAHRAAGFFEVGIQPRHGVLDGEWKDCVLVERLLGPALIGDERTKT
jgi:phosphinothricin acetyltransferase